MFDQSNMHRELVSNPPFLNGWQTGRLLHDLGAMISLLTPEMFRVQFWILAQDRAGSPSASPKMGHEVTAFDIRTDLAGCIEGRVNADSRIDPLLINYKTGDEHAYAGCKRFVCPRAISNLMVVSMQSPMAPSTFTLRNWSTHFAGESTF